MNTLNPPGGVFRAAACASAWMLALSAPSYAQQSPEDEVVQLSPFKIEESADMGRYQAAEVTSGSRVSTSLMDTTQSISVVTNEFLSDIGTDRLLDATKYVAGISAGTQPNALDMMNVRGFASYGATLDGFSQFNWINQDPVVVERIEIVKGPNAILIPAGNPGGLVNNVTKRPKFNKNSGSISYQVGRWDSNRAEIDANYVVRQDKLAVRVVGAFTDADDYGKDEFHQNVTVMPMFTYRLSPTTEFTAQLQMYNASVLANNGNPLSPYALGRENVHLLEGVSRDFQIMKRNITRHQNGQNFRFFLTSQFTDKLSMRLVGNWVEQSVRTNFLGASNPHKNPHVPREIVGLPPDPNTPVIALDPITGEWGYTGATLTSPPRYYLGGANEWPKLNYGHLQNDFSYTHSAPHWKSQTVAGYAISYSSQHQRIKNYNLDPTWYDLTDPSFVPPDYSLPVNWRDNWSARNRSSQVYLYQVLTLLDEKLVLSGSVAHNNFYGSGHDNLNDTRNMTEGETTTPAGGVIVKLIPEVSLYYGFTKQELVGGANEADGIPQHTVPSTQHEVGVRFKLFDGRLFATFAHFDITQDNLWQQNFANYVQPRPDPPLPAVLSNRTSKGFEFELAWSPTKNFSLIASYTDYKNRDQDDMRFTNVPEEMAGIWASYSFSEGSALRGLRIGLGANYTGERAGDAESVWTEPPEGFDPVRAQPSFWIPSFVVAEATVNYQINKNWSAMLIVRNLLDKDYIPGSFNRSIFVSTPINPKLTLRYEF